MNVTTPSSSTRATGRQRPDLLQLARRERAPRDRADALRRRRLEPVFRRLEARRSELRAQARACNEADRRGEQVDWTASRERTAELTALDRQYSRLDSSLAGRRRGPKALSCKIAAPTCTGIRTNTRARGAGRPAARRQRATPSACSRGGDSGDSSSPGDEGPGSLAHRALTSRRAVVA